MRVKQGYLLSTIAILIALLATACGGGGGGGGNGVESPAPIATTLAVENVTEEGVTLRGRIDANGYTTQAWFEWSLNPDMTGANAIGETAIDAKAEAADLVASLEGLVPGVTYYYRPVAKHPNGTLRRGEIDYFTPTQTSTAHLTVNCEEDPDEYQPGKLTIREALGMLEDGGILDFDARLSGKTITLRKVANSHTMLKGEVFTMSAGRWVFQGYQTRDYGKSALYTPNSVTIDASLLPEPVTLAWGGEEEARVFAAHGLTTMRKLKIRNGVVRAEALAGAQPFTLARGGGIAVWGIAALYDCEFSGNRVYGDTTASRDRGAFGGGVYADTVWMRNCIVGGNSAEGYGASGGGVFSLGGVETWANSQIIESSVGGNSVTAQHAYGGGVYSDGGGPGRQMSLYLENCTIAGNAVKDNPDIPQSTMSQYYYRGGGIYMSNGYLDVAACTITGNQVTGNYYEFSGKPNMGGGGIAATIGNAHVVESTTLKHSIIVGNTVAGAAEDVFSGSLINFFSEGYNLVGVINFNYMLPPIPWWGCLSRVHWPKEGDRDSVSVGEALNPAGPVRHEGIDSVGALAGKMPLYYLPGTAAKNKLPQAPYAVSSVWAEYSLSNPSVPDTFLNRVILKVREVYGSTLGSDFGSDLGDYTGVTFYGPAETWPSDPANTAWINFWKTLTAKINGRLGPEGLNDDFWANFQPGWLDANTHLDVDIQTTTNTMAKNYDMIGNPRPAGTEADIGAIEGD